MRKTSFQGYILNLFLCFLLVFTGSPFQLYFEARANSTTPSDAQAEAEQAKAEKNKLVAELRSAFLEPSQGQAALDPFELTRQRIIDERQGNLEAYTQEQKIADFTERVEYLTRQIEALQGLMEQVEGRLSGLNPTTDKQKFTELTLIKSDIESRKQLFALELADVKKHDPRSTEGLPVDLMIDQELRTRHYWGNKLQILLGDPQSPEVKVEQKNFTESLSPRFNAENPIAELQSERPGFVIADHRGRHLHEFFKPVSAVFFFGPYLVYLEKESLEKADGRVNLRFVDMNFARANIGNTPLPVFTMPLVGVENPGEMKIENGRLRVGNLSLSHPQFAVISKSQQLVFNVHVALVDPASYKGALPLVTEIAEVFSKNMKAQGDMFSRQLEKAVAGTKYLTELTDAIQGRSAIDPGAARQTVADALKDGQITNTEYENILKSLDAEKSMTEANEAMRQGRKFTTRMRILMQNLIQPRPQGSAKIFNSLAILAFGSSDERGRTLDDLRERGIFKLAKYGAATGGVILASQFLPEAYQLSFYKAADLARATHQHFVGYLEHINFGKAYAELSVDAFVTATTGWTYFFQSYFSDGVWTKFLYGLGSVLLIPIKLFGSIHFAINSAKMFQETMKVRKLSSGELSFLQSFKEAARLDRVAYWKGLAEAEKQSSGADAEKMSQRDVEILDKHIERLKTGRVDISAVERDLRAEKFGTRTAIGQLVLNIAGYFPKFDFANKVTSVFRAKGQQIQASQDNPRAEASEQTFRRALMDAFVSYSSLRSTFKFNAITWNYLFITRSFFWSPSKWLMLTIYPNYFGVTIDGESGRQRVPSIYNRGTQLWPRKLHDLFSRVANKMGAQNRRFTGALFTSPEALAALDAFEKLVEPIEMIAKEVAIKKATVALIRYVKDPERVVKIFDSAQTSEVGRPSTGLTSLHDPAIKQLKGGEKVFFRAYFTRTYDLIMQHYIKEVTDTKATSTMDPVEFAKAVQKELRSGTDLSFKMSKENLLAMEADIESKIDFNKVFEWSNRLSHSAVNFVRRLDMNFRHKLLASIHPQNPQMARFLTARSQVEKPRAMERAMRMEVSSMVASIPMGILTTLALYAGVGSGILQPFDATAMDTETHFRYMSRYLFYNGFIPGLIIGMMANTWMKVQMDSRIDGLGGFDQAIKQSDGVRGFWRYYLKNVFKNPMNKWKANQLFYMKLIWANIPAAAVTIIVANLYGLGRIDVGTFMAGYIVVFTTFLTGFNLKIEQAFELASRWFYNRIPRPLRAHPKAQAYINNQIQKRKIVFGYIESFYGFLVNEGIAGELLVLKDNVKYGSRAFLRLVFGGLTPTEMISNLTDSMMRAFSNMPGLENAIMRVKILFTYNYEAYERFSAELIKAGDAKGVERVMERFDLPKNMAGEFLGKASAAVATIGTYAAVPYVLSDALDRVNKARIQALGKRVKVRCSTVFASQ